jgi:hypothetical protein
MNKKRIGGGAASALPPPNKFAGRCGVDLSDSQADFPAVSFPGRQLLFFSPSPSVFDMTTNG